MDWEGGTIGAIVPALMGHGEAGRASPWPFFFANAAIRCVRVNSKKQKNGRPSIAWATVFFLDAEDISLREELVDHIAVADQGDGATRIRVVLKAGIDAQVVVEAGSDIVG